MNNVTVQNTVIADQIADGINFHQGVTNSKVVNSLIRNTGDDGLAMWSQAVGGQPGIEDANNVFDHNTVQNPVLANGIAIYGGHHNNVSNNIVAEPVRAGNATFQNVVARNVGAVGINNCGSFHFTQSGSEFTVTDLGGNTGGGNTGPWLAPWELPNTITCDDRPPVVPPPPPLRLVSG